MLVPVDCLLQTCFPGICRGVPPWEYNIAR